MILDKLLPIPADATTATIQGVEMQIISTEQADKMLEADTKDVTTHECILKNGNSYLNRRKANSQNYIE